MRMPRPRPAVLAVLAIAAVAAPARAVLDDEDPLPLDPARTIEYTVERGTWMSVDVSPDGSTILFDLLGDLYTLPIDGGDATPLTEGMAIDRQPRYSPDGERILFVSDRGGADEVWVMNADGSEAKALTRGDDGPYISPAWAPDGEYIAVARQERGLFKLRLYHVDGGSGVAMIAGEDNARLNTLGPAFTPDGRHVWFAHKQGGFGGYNMTLPQWQLGVHDRWTGEVFAQGRLIGSGMRPLVSPDGRWLVYATRHEEQTGLRLRDLGSGEDRWLAYPVTRDDQESFGALDLMPGASFLPDSSALVTTIDGGLVRIAIPDGALSEIPFRVAVERELGPELDFQRTLGEGPVVARQIRDPRLSPDGDRLVFTAFDMLWVADADGSDPRRIAPMEDSAQAQPAWSPDGTSIAFVSWSDQEGGHLWRVLADGAAAPERLTSMPGFYSRPVWSPDGERLLVTRGPTRERIEDVGPEGIGGQGLELYWLPATGGDLTLVTHLRGGGQPHFGADPERIFLFEGGDGLVSFRWDGTDRRAHVKVTAASTFGSGPPGPADEVLMGPDGRQAIAASANQVYLLQVPLVGGEVPTISLASPDGAPVPVRRLTRTGGEFMQWVTEAGDATGVSWALGRWLFRYDLAAAESAIAEARAREEADASESDAGAESSEEADSEEDQPGEEDDDDEAPAYEADEIEVVVEQPRALPQGTVLLSGGRILTMNGEEVIEPGDLLIRGHRIAAVGPVGSLEVPEGTTVIDVTGRTLMPGLVDVHSHYWSTMGVHKRQVWELLANLAYGVTTAHDVQTSTTDFLTYRDLVEAGIVLGPRIFSTGPGVFGSELIEDLDDARDVLSRYARYFGLHSIKQYLVGDRKRRQWVIEAARELELLPTTEGGANLPLMLSHATDGYPGVEHSFPYPYVHDDVVEFFARSGTVYTPTLIVAYGSPDYEKWFHTHEPLHDDAKLRRFTPHVEVDAISRRGPWFADEEYMVQEHAEAAGRVIDAGGRVGIGGHGQRQGLGTHWELWSLASGGVSSHEALRAATIVGAEAIGLAREIGSLEVGKLADVLVLDADPRDDIRNTTALRYVVKDGRVYEADTLDEVWPRQQPLPAQYWWEVDPLR